MSVTRADVERVAQLAALAVDPEALPGLTAQIARILDYVSQLEAADGLPGPGAAPLSAGPALPLRADLVRSPDLARDLQSIAPAMREGLFVVPKLSAMEDA